MNDTKRNTTNEDACHTSEDSCCASAQERRTQLPEDDYCATVHERRTQLRQEALEERCLMPQPYRLHKSALICDRLLQSFDLTVGITGKTPSECTVAVYAAFPEEVQLDDFIRGLYDRGARVAFPCMVSDARGVATACQQTMEMRGVTEADYAAQSVYFLQHPLKTYTHDSADITPYPFVGADELTMLIVPVVAFDKHHNRLGYGGGNYDRYLTQVDNATCRVVGVAFAEQEVDTIPVEEHDVALPIVSL